MNMVYARICRDTLKLAKLHYKCEPWRGYSASTNTAYRLRLTLRTALKHNRVAQPTEWKMCFPNSVRCSHGLTNSRCYASQKVT
ncbi:hypothetical protein TNCV_4296251 [Trichonephila clavipes]|nr:hypothetical protein TNCV_4296251 [Trichonephila clavipes]